MSSVIEIDDAVERHVLSYAVDNPLFINDPYLFKPIAAIQRCTMLDVSCNINKLQLVLIHYISTLVMVTIELSDMVDDEKCEIVSIYQQIISMATNKIEYLIETHDDHELILNNTIKLINTRLLNHINFSDYVLNMMVPMLIPKQPIVDDFICPLSLDLVTAKNDTYRYVLPCGHQFSKEIKKWKHNTCPMCRQNIL